jgi:hypothetical protein
MTAGRHGRCIPVAVAHSNPISRTLLTSAVTSAATTAALFLLSSKDTGHPAAALNATSHILWGDQAAKHDDLDVRHTLVGGLLNAGAMGFWSAVQALFPEPRSAFGALRNATVVTALAYVTDYYVVPKRLTPGFEQRLSPKSLFGAYAVLAASLAVSAFATRRRS